MTISRFCDGLTRRHVLQAGLGGLAGLGLPDLLRLQARSAAAARDTAVIYVLQEGGAPQFETYDPKPDAPVEYRGEFKAIPTSVPGVHFSAAMPLQARQMHRLTVLRSIHHPSTQHSSSVHLIKTGYYCRPEAEDNEMPAVGAYAARVRGASQAGLPPCVLLNSGARYDGGHFLGRGHDPFLIKWDSEKVDFPVPGLTLSEGLTDSALRDRRALLASFDQAARLHDLKGSAAAIDQFQARAFEMVTGKAARRAFNLDQEPPALRDRYGRTPVGQKLLLARRLVEQGVTFVTVGTFNWDYHGNLWTQMKRDAPAFDRGLAALVEDLHERGLAKRVLVVVMGEFGRTPVISSLPNTTPGRDHWGDAMSVLLAGGGLPGGQIVGATDRKGAYPTHSPYRVESVLAHMYRHLGIDPGLTFDDHTGRPRYLLERRDPIRELS